MRCANDSFVLFDLILYVPSTVFQLNREGSSWVEPVLSWDKCVLLKDHNIVTLVRHKPAIPRSRVEHSTTELPQKVVMQWQMVLNLIIVCLFDSLRSLNNLSVMRDGSSWVEPVLS